MTTLPNNAPEEVAQAFARLNPMQRALALALPTAKDHETAMREAGYAASTARKQAGRIAKHPDIATVVNWIIGNAISAASDSVERMIQELCRIALYDPRGLFDDKGNLLPIHDWPEDLARCVSSLDVFEEFAGKGDEREFVGFTKKLRLFNKIDAIDKVSKIRGYYRPEQHEHTHRVEGLAGLLKEIDGADTGPGPARSRGA